MPAIASPQLPGLQRIKIAGSDHLRQCRRADDCERVGRREQRFLTL